MARTKAQEMAKLAMVAGMMNEWTRQENTAYYQRMIQLREYVDTLTEYISELEESCSILANHVVEQEITLDLWVPERTTTFRIEHSCNGVPELIMTERLSDEDLEQHLFG